MIHKRLDERDHKLSTTHKLCSLSHEMNYWHHKFLFMRHNRRFYAILFHKFLSFTFLDVLTYLQIEKKPLKCFRYRIEKKTFKMFSISDWKKTFKMFSISDWKKPFKMFSISDWKKPFKMFRYPIEKKPLKCFFSPGSRWLRWLFVIRKCEQTHPVFNSSTMRVTLVSWKKKTFLIFEDLNRTAVYGFFCL